MAESSWKTRKSQWTHYDRFCEQLMVSPMPCSDELLCMYIAYMARSFKYVSIVNYVSAVRGLHKWYGYIPPALDSFLVKSTLLGAKRLLGDSQFSSDPLLPVHLKKIGKTLDLQKTNDFVFWCAVVLSFRGLLRKSSVCKGEINLLRRDIEFCPWGLLISIRKSKTIQFRERVHQVPIALVGGPLCAASLLLRMYKMLPATQDHPLFGLTKNNVYRPITYDWFAKKLSSCVSKAGLVGKFTSHSLRRGGATALSMVGVPLYQIQKRGDWKSLSVLVYLASPLDYRINHEISVAKTVVHLDSHQV